MSDDNLSVYLSLMSAIKLAATQRNKFQRCHWPVLASLAYMLVSLASRVLDLALRKAGNRSLPHVSTTCYQLSVVIV